MCDGHGKSPCDSMFSVVDHYKKIIEKEKNIMNFKELVKKFKEKLDFNVMTLEDGDLKGKKK